MKDRIKIHCIINTALTLRYLPDPDRQIESFLKYNLFINFLLSGYLKNSRCSELTQKNLSASAIFFIMAEPRGDLGPI